MAKVTLDERDRAVLAELRHGDASVEHLAAAADCSPGDLRDRLPELADNGLVESTGDGYAITASGERLLAASPAGDRDDRIDAPAEVRDRVASFDLRRDREDAVLAAFSFLHYWGAATAGEIVDAVYSARPAGFDAPTSWWRECIRDRLVALPGVEVPGEDDRTWRYAGTPKVDESDGADGRVAPGDVVPEGSSATFAVHRLDLDDDERTAVLAAFDHLVFGGEIGADEIRSEVYADHDAGYDDSETWLEDCVAPALDALRGVERTTDGGWRYRPRAEGPMSTGPGAEVPDASLDGEEDPDGGEGGPDGE